MAKTLNALFTGTLLLLTFLIFLNPQKINIKANKWFGTFILCLFLITFQTLLFEEGLKISNLFLESLINLSNFSVAPVFYLSVSYFIEPEKKWKNSYFFHFSFPILMFILQTLTLLSDKKEPVDPNVELIVNIVFCIIFAAQVLIYCALSYRRLIKHQQNIRLFTSSTGSINLKWLQYICLITITIAIFWVFEILFRVSEKNSYFDNFSSLLYLFSAFFIAYHWFGQKEIFPYEKFQIDEIQEIITETSLNEESRKRLLSDDKLEVAKKELINLMTNEKPFLDCELSLVKLASQMNMSPHMLSYIINEGFNENFFLFINRYRIEEAKKLIVNPEMNHLTLVGISYEVGFNSKTVFNTTFKKLTGKTPTDYKKSQGILV